MVIEIAGGILLAVLILCLLPYIILAISFAFCVAVVIAVIFGACWATWVGYQSPGGLAVELTIGGVFLLWLFYEVKARRQAAEDTERSAE